MNENRAVILAGLGMVPIILYQVYEYLFRDPSVEHLLIAMSAFMVMCIAIYWRFSHSQ